jgi:hypothetical protein
MESLNPFIGVSFRVLHLAFQANRSILQRLEPSLAGTYATGYLGYPGIQHYFNDEEHRLSQDLQQYSSVGLLNGILKHLHLPQ